jgi:hypothetical protein
MFAEPCVTGEVAYLTSGNPSSIPNKNGGIMTGTRNNDLAQIGAVTIKIGENIHEFPIREMEVRPLTEAALEQTVNGLAEQVRKVLWEEFRKKYPG